MRSRKSGTNRPFLSLASFASFESGLKEIARALETKLSITAGEVTAKAQIIRQTFGLERSASFERSELLKLLQDRLASAGLQSDEAGIVDLQKLAEKVSGELGGEGSSRQLSLLGAAKHQAQQLTSPSLLLPLYDQVLAASEELADELESSAEKVPVQLLVHALEHVSGITTDLCPICEQPVNHASLMDRLTERIKEDEAVRILARTLEARLKALCEASAAARQAYTAFVAGWEMLALGSLEPCYLPAVKLFARLEALTIKTSGEQREEIKAEFADVECDPSIEITRIDETIVAVGGGERRTRLVETASLIASLRNDVVTYERCQRDVLILAKQKSVADKLHAHAEAARKAAVQNVADRVATQANAFYEEIHPGEGIATSTLTVRQATSGSMQLGSTFHGREAQPLLYYSESHLDTLGLCYFLAIRKLEIASSPAFKLLLVDDVLHSVDADHRTRLARLLKDHFGDHQIFLVTHDKHFFDRLRAIFGGPTSTWPFLAGISSMDPGLAIPRRIWIA
jgi:hypothetical protein